MGFWTVLDLGASLAHLQRLLYILLMLVHIERTSPLVKMDQNQLVNIHNVLTVMVSAQVVLTPITDSFKWAFRIHDYFDVEIVASVSRGRGKSCTSMGLTI